jgi:hypothetical protein
VSNERTYNAVIGRLARLRDALGEETQPVVPASEIIARVARRRVRRRVSEMTGVLAVAAVAAVAATALLPASHPASKQPSNLAHAQLTAWTVSRQANGTVLVTVREFRDRAGLQSTLRADGIPVSIIFIPAFGIPANVFTPGNPCREFTGDGNGPGTFSPLVLKVAHLVDPHAADPFQGGVIINPSALPDHVGLQLYITRGLGNSSLHHDAADGYFEDLVQDSPACTGS